MALKRKNTDLTRSAFSAIVIGPINPVFFTYLDVLSRSERTRITLRHNR